MSALPFALTLSYAAMMALAVAINLMPVFLISLRGDFGALTDEQLGRIGAVTFAGLVAAIAATGPVVDRLPVRGPRVAAVAGNVLVGIGLVMLWAAPSYPMVLAACGMMGFGAGVLDMVLSPIVSALQPRHRTVAMNMLHAFYCVGAVVTILAGASAIRWGIGWRMCALLLIPLPALVAIGFAALRLPPLVAEGFDRTPLKKLSRESFFILACAAIFLGGATELAMAFWLPKYAEKDLGFAKWTADMSFLAFSFAMAVGRVLIGFLGHKLDAMVLMLSCCIGSVVLFLVASFAPDPRLALAACILAGLTGSALWPSTLAVSADRYPHGGASMFGLLAAFGNFGGIFMPWMAGIIADASSLRWGLATSALCPLLMIPALLWMRRHRRASELERTSQNAFPAV